MATFKRRLYARLMAHIFQAQETNIDSGDRGMQAEKIMIDSEENKEYLPIQGLEAFNKATADLLLGQGHAATKVSHHLVLKVSTPCMSGAASLTACPRKAGGGKVHSLLKSLSKWCFSDGIFMAYGYPVRYSLNFHHGMATCKDDRFRGQTLYQPLWCLQSLVNILVLPCAGEQGGHAAVPVRHRVAQSGRRVHCQVPPRQDRLPV